MENVIYKYNDIGDDFFYHHTLTEGNGEIYYNGPEVHRQYEVLHLIEGEISYIIEGETYTAAPGDMIFVCPGEIHTLRIDGRQRYERRVLLFDMGVMEALFNDARVSLPRFFGNYARKLRIIKGASVEECGLGRILTEITECDEKEPYKRMKVVARLLEFIICLDKIGKSDSSERIRPSRIDPLINRIAEYIDAHISEKILIGDMSEALFVSRSTLSHRFAAHMNMPLCRYITVKKMHRADKLMHEGLSASEASREVGYDNYTTFYYNFKQIMGAPPSVRR